MHMILENLIQCPIPLSTVLDFNTWGLKYNSRFQHSLKISSKETGQKLQQKLYYCLKTKVWPQANLETFFIVFTSDDHNTYLNKQFNQIKLSST